MLKKLCVLSCQREHFPFIPSDSFLLGPHSHQTFFATISHIFPHLPTSSTTSPFPNPQPRKTKHTTHLT